jgi:nucleoid DNA-binding protein
MDDIILDLLKTKGRIIVPDFGAFIIKSKSPFKVIFNEFLQYNDGALIGATAGGFNLERDDAAKKVKEYVTDISKQLDKGTPVSLSGIGVLSKSSTGKITLNETLEEAQQVTQPTENNTSNTVEFDIDDTQKEEAKRTPEEKVKEKTEEKKQIIPDKKKVDIQETHKPTASSSPKPTPVVEKKTAEKPIKPTPVASIHSTYTSKNKLNIILWVALIVIVNAAIIGYFLLDDKIKGAFGSKKPAQKEEIIKTPKIIENQSASTTSIVTPEEELVIEETTDPEKSSQVFSGKKYYVVAGAFSDEKNADALVVELKQKGYNADKFGKIGVLYAVSYDVFPTKQEADKLMLKIKKEVNTGAWIKVIK